MGHVRQLLQAYYGCHCSVCCCNGDSYVRLPSRALWAGGRVPRGSLPPVLRRAPPPASIGGSRILAHRRTVGLESLALGNRQGRKGEEVTGAAVLVKVVRLKTKIVPPFFIFNS